MVKKVCFLLIFIVLLTLLIGQTSPWHVYRPANRASDIVYRAGELWISSLAGIMRWNPDTNAKTQIDIMEAPLLGNYIGSMHVAASGDLWAASSVGVLRYDGEAWTSFDASNSILDGSIAKCVAEDNNAAIWIATEAGIYKYYQGIWIVYNSSNSDLPQAITPRGIAIDSQNLIWVSGYGGVWCFDGSTWFQYSTANSSLPSSSITCIAFEADGTGWFGHNGGVAKYTNGEWINYPSLNGVDLSYMKNIYVDALQRVWFSSQRNLLCKDGNSYQNYPQSLFADYWPMFDEVLVDPQLRIWITFYDPYSPKSLVKYDGVNATHYAISNMPLPSRDVQEIFKGFDDKIWIASSYIPTIGGYISIDDEIIDAYGWFNTDMYCEHVWALAQDSQMNIWVSTCVKLLRIGTTGSQSFYQTEAGISTGNLKTICSVGDGVWIGGNAGVSRYQNGTWTVLSSAEAGISLANTRMIKMDSEGGIWIGGSNGITRYFNGSFTASTQITGVRDFAFGADGTIWVARGELSCFSGGTWTHFNSSNSGLLQNHAGCVAVDNNNKVWVGSAFPDCVLYSFHDGLWGVLNSNNSPLSGNQINAIYVDDDNTKWIGGNDLYLFNETGLPTSAQEQLVPPARSIGNYPNPFTANTTIRFHKDSVEPLHLSIYNLRGQKVWTYEYRGPDKGEIEITWNGKDIQGNSCAAGIYIIQLNDKARSKVAKILKLAR